MARPIKGDVRTQRFRRKLADGTVYVYERQVIYNPKTLRNDTLSCHLVGKILKGTTEIIPTRFKARSRKERPEQSNTTTGVVASRYHFGMSSLLSWVGRDSGIDDDLHSAMPEETYGPLAERIISLARFWVATGGDTLPNLETWQLKHGITDENALTEDLCRKIFDVIGQDESIVQHYFMLRAAHLNVKGGAVAYDSTTTSTYSRNQGQARFGFNKDGDGLPTIKLLSLYSLTGEQPFAFCEQPGNIPDVLCIKNALKQIDYLNGDGPLLVTDNGFYSTANLVDLVGDHIKFLMRVQPSNGAWIKKAVMENLERLDDPEYCMPWDTDTYGFTVTVRPELTSTCRYNTGNHHKGDKITITPRLYLSIFRNRDRMHEEQSRFDAELFQLKRSLEEEQELTDAALNKAARYMEWRRVRGGKIDVSFKKEECLAAKQLCGIYATLSNKTMETAEALQLYRRREHIEDMFELFKQKADGKKPRVWDRERLWGRHLVQFVALSYYDYLYGKLKKLKATLGTQTGDKKHDTEANLNAERSLLRWVNARSLGEILKWFDAVEITSLGGNSHPALRIITEQTSRDLMLLDKIDYKGDLNS